MGRVLALFGRFALQTVGHPCAVAGVMLLIANATALGRTRAPLPRVSLTTDLGAIEIEVDLRRAPLSGAAFLRHVVDGTFDHSTFYRVVRPDNDNASHHVRIVQGGQPIMDPSWPTVPHEPTSITGLRHRDGTVSLTRAAPGSATGAVFFISIGDQPSLDYGGARQPDGQGFAAFGRVTKGMGIIRAISSMQTDPGAGSPYLRGQFLRRPVTIIAARIAGCEDARIRTTSFTSERRFGPCRLRNRFSHSPPQQP